MAHLMDVFKAFELKRTHVCATCWGELRVRDLGKRDRLAEVSCFTPGCECRGFAYRKEVQKRKAQDARDASEVRRNLGPALGLPQEEHMSVEEFNRRVFGG